MACVDPERVATPSTSEARTVVRPCLRARDWGRRCWRPQCLHCGWSAVRADLNRRKCRSGGRRTAPRTAYSGYRTGARSGGRTCGNGRPQPPLGQRRPWLPQGPPASRLRGRRTLGEPLASGPWLPSASLHRRTIAGPWWNLPHRLRPTPTDLAGDKRWNTASGRPGEPFPPITG